MGVSALLTAAFAEANGRYADVHAAWTAAGLRIGGLLPASLLAVSIQLEGRFDVLIRALEDENAQMLDDPDKGMQVPYALSPLSEYWISGMYETFRLLTDRKLAGTDTESIFRALELVRMGIDKHEVPKDYTLHGPLQFVKVGEGNEAKSYDYDKKDPMRAHIMPMGVSQRGSLQWRVIDLRNKRELWIERRELSDSILELWKKPKPFAVD